MELVQAKDTQVPGVHSSRRLLELDGVRGFACISVMIWHYMIAPITWQQVPLHARLGNLGVLLGPSGVDLFFVLSGFLISGILFDNLQSPHYFRTFYIRRTCRIFPVYYLMVLSFLIGIAVFSDHAAVNAWLLKDTMPVYTYGTFIQNFYMAVAGHAGGKWMAMSWSVDVEEHFYMIFPLVVWLVPMLRLRYLVLGAIVAAPVLRVLAGKLGLWYYPLLPCRVDGLAVGVLAAYLVRQPVVLAWFRENRGMFYFSLLTCGLGFAFFSDNLLGYTWMALFFGTFILLVVVHPDTFAGAVCRHPALRWIGLISYGLYMYHQTVNGLFHALLLDQAPVIRNLRDLGVTLLSTGTVFALASLSYYGMEKWLVRLGHRAQWFPKVEPAASSEADPPTLSRAA